MLMPELEQSKVAVEKASSASAAAPRPPVRSFCKTLTASDTSTHGGISVLRRHADECLPPLAWSLDNRISPIASQIFFSTNNKNPTLITRSRGTRILQILKEHSLKQRSCLKDRHNKDAHQPPMRGVKKIEHHVLG